MKRLAPFIPFLVVIILGLVCSVLIFEVFIDQNRRQVQTQIRQASLEQHGNIADRIHSIQTVLRAVVGFYEGSSHVSREEFEAFAKKIGAPVQALGFVPRVTAAERRAFEAAASDEGMSHFRFTERSLTGERLSAGARDTYFPIFYVEPLAGNEAAIGFDLASNPVSLAALIKARDKLSMVVSGRVNLLADKEDRASILVVAPIFGKNMPAQTQEDRRQNLEGFALAMIRVEKLISGFSRAASPLRQLPSEIDFYVFDADEADDPSPLYAQHVSELADQAHASTLSQARSGFFVEQALQFGGRKWLLITRLDEAETVGTIPLQSWVILLASLIVTSLLGFYLYSLVTRNQTIRTQVKDQTEELSEVLDALQTNEQRFRDFTSTASDWVWELGPDLCFTNVSGRFFEINQLKEADIIGKSRWEFVSAEMIAEDPEKWAEHRECLEAHRSFRDFSYQIRISSVDRRTITLSGNPVFGKDGSFQGYRGTGTDSTELKAAEIRLRESEQRFRAMVENAGDAIYIHNRYGKIFDVNQVACEQVGYTRDELLSLSVARLDASIDFESLRQTWDLGEADPTNYPMTLETAHRRKDGTVFPIEVRISLLPSDEDTRFVAVVRDITERKQVENKLAEKVRELDFQKFALDEHAIVSIADAKGDITYVNQQFVDISGFPHEELLGQNHRMLNSDLHAKAFFADLWQTIGSGNVWHGDIRNSKKKGGFYWVRATIVPFLDEQGKPFQYVAIRTDITERKLVEAEAEAARNAAETANRAKSDFLSSMSHELRTPMNAILGFAQMLEFNPKEPLTTLQKKCVGNIMRGGNHLLELINEVLELAKIEAGKVTVLTESVSAKTIVDECLTMIEPTAKSRSVEISRIDIPADLKLVSADYTRLKQVLLNFLSNAIKYNREGGRVTVEAAETAVDTVRFSITDTGFGIAEDQYDQLFEPFNRLGAETTAIEGTGIGLSVTKNLVELMQGTVGFTSSVGKGSTFWVELPVASDESSDQQASDDALESGAAKGLPETHGTLLYVEDNPDNLELMELIVARIEGLSMISAHTAELGLDLAREHLPDAIILDINLPGMNGIEALKKLQEMDETANIPVFALSAAATQSDIEKGIAAGFRFYLTKPVKVEEVADAIKQVIKPLDQ